MITDLLSEGMYPKMITLEKSPQQFNNGKIKLSLIFIVIKKVILLKYG